MLTLRTLFAIAATIAGTATASAQWYPAAPYAPPPHGYAYPAPQTYQAEAVPPSWYYNPYTSGLGPCPQRARGDERCADRIAPSYGQPSYWVR